MQPQYHVNYHFPETAQYQQTQLIQLGRRYCMPAEVIQKHAHMDWYELTIVIGGEGIVLTNEEPVAVSKGDIYLSFPGDFHEIRSSAAHPLQYDFFSFHSLNSTIKKELRRIAERTYFCDQRVFRDESVQGLVAFAISEISSQEKYHKQVLSSILEQTLYLILRNFDSDKKESKKMRTNAADELCFQIMHYIDTHIYSIENLSDLSEEFSFNYSYLSKLFKNTTGKTLSDYYQSRRLDAARLLILEKKLKINQIAETLHYSSLYAFSKAFKNRYGVSPTHFTN